jgi:hypothetical protein
MWYSDGLPGNAVLPSAQVVLPSVAMQSLHMHVPPNYVNEVVPSSQTTSSQQPLLECGSPVLGIESASAW